MGAAKRQASETYLAVNASTKRGRTCSAQTPPTASGKFSRYSHLATDDADSDWSDPEAGGWFAGEVDDAPFESALESWEAFEEDIDELERRTGKVAVVLEDLEDVLERQEPLTRQLLRCAVPVLLLSRDAHASLELLDDRLDDLAHLAEHEPARAAAQHLALQHEGLRGAAAGSPSERFERLCALSVPLLDDAHLGYFLLHEAVEAERHLLQLWQAWSALLGLEPSELGVSKRSRRSALALLRGAAMKLAEEGMDTRQLAASMDGDERLTTKCKATVGLTAAAQGMASS